MSVATPASDRLSVVAPGGMGVAGPGVGDPDGVGARGIQGAVGFKGKGQRTEDAAALQRQFGVELREPGRDDADGSCQPAHLS